jgi:DNA-binding NarL/FixJ family response regulator
VLLVDDHRLVRAGLAALIATVDDLVVVGEAEDGRQAVERARQLAPDVVLMDLSMPVMDGVDATRALMAENPQVRVVILTSFSETERVSAALDAGAIGYLLKDCDPRELIAAVRAAAAGNVPLDPRVTRALLTAVRRPEPAPFDAAGDRGRADQASHEAAHEAPTAPIDLASLDGAADSAGDKLSAREKEVLALVARGYANKQIARALGISERTVKVHLGNVFRRIGVGDRTSAALWARDNLS